MKKTFLLKTLLLLCALVVEGTTSAWATPTTILSFSRSGNTNTTTAGYTFSASASTDTGYYKDGKNTTGLKLYSTSTALFSSTPSTVTFTAKVGGGSGNTDLANSVYVCFIDKDGNSIADTETLVTSHITTNTGDTYNISMPLAKATQAYGVYIYHTKETGYNVRYYSFSLSYEAAPAHTITAVSNDDDMGTVSGTTTITATPKSGYRVKAGTDGYTVTSGTATVTNNGDNTFSVTASSDCTVRINFEAIPTHTLSSVADPVAGGTIELGATSILEGATATATASPNAGFKFTGWSISGTGASLSSTSSNPTTVTMGTADATVTANFEAVVTHEIKWSVNGVIVKTENVEENTAIDFAAPASGVPVGFTFMGWVVEANKIDSPTDIEPSANYVTSANSTVDITYYAVIAELKSAATEVTTTLANNTIKNNATGKSSYSDSYNIENWTGHYLINNNSGNYTLQLGYNTDKSKSAHNSHLTTPSAAENIQSITIEANQAVTFYLCSASDLGTADSEDATYGSGATTAQNKTVTINVTGNTKHLYIYPSGTANIKSISMTSGSPAVYKNFCTSATIPATMGTNGYTTFANANVLDLVHLPSGLTAYKASVTGSTVKFTEINDQAVPANTGLLLKGEAGETYNIPVAASGTDVTGNAFLVNTAGTTFTGDDNYYYFGLKKNTLTFGLFDPASVAIPANKAYLKVSKSAGARELTVLFDDEATGIEDLTPALSKGEGVVYDLSGRRVVTPAKGLYIVNGRKVVVK
ncbi:MAG: hypothetical protein K6D91_08660 [Prevotella sp.]|nr:hypothetical protein [Prevotella sp.]